MDEPHLDITPDMDEKEILARVGRFIWKHSDSETRSRFDQQAAEQGLDRGETALLEGLVEDRLRYESMEEWLDSLSGNLNR